MRTKWAVPCVALSMILTVLSTAGSPVSGQGREPGRFVLDARLFYGPTSIKPGQTARLYVANVVDPANGVGSQPSDDQLELSLFDEFGTLLARSVEIVTPGRTAMLEFTSRDASLIRAEVRLLVGGAPFVSSLELIGLDGETLHFVQPQSKDSCNLFGVPVPGNAPIPEFCSIDTECPAGLNCVFGICLPF